MLAAASLALLLSACGDAAATAATIIADTPVILISTGSAGSPTPTAGAGPAGNPSSTPRPSPAAEEWMTLPVVPDFDGAAAEIFRRGISMRRDFHAFSKIGDCQNITTYFLADFDQHGKYRLGEYADLQETIDWFQGFFGRKSLAVKGGLNVASVMNPLLADPATCLSGESPLACELRVNNPSLALISFEEAWDGDVEKYETYLRKVIEYAIEQGVVPVVATKADNLEGGNRINELIARLAWEYEIPLWNFWRAVQPLPYHGLAKDGFHLTQAREFHNYYFDLPPNKWSGWMGRNLSALQALDAAREELIAPVVT
ncbi:MAG: hypothetical protein A3K46_03520 [Chloroflexi bacterium RBG_13_60_9]|nr:MAG: hypothetical protein A3K46_03520 [Chloroflexi bacterium RBG_13_60_9]